MLLHSWSRDAKRASKAASGCAPGLLPVPPYICSANPGPRFGYKPTQSCRHVFGKHIKPGWRVVEALEVDASSRKALVELAPEQVLGLGWRVWPLWPQSQPAGGGAEGCGCLFKCGQDFLLHFLIALQVISPASGERGQTVKIIE